MCGELIPRGMPACLPSLPWENRRIKPCYFEFICSTLNPLEFIINIYRCHFASYLLMVIRVMNSHSCISQTPVSMWLGDLVPVSSKCHDAVVLKTPSGLDFIWKCRRDILICFSCFAISRCWSPYLKTKKCFSITVIRRCVTFWSVVSHLCTFLVTLTLVGVHIISSTYQQWQAVISSEPQVSHFAPRPSERDG